MSDISASSAQLIDVCSYPSQEPNSDPSDCVMASTANATTTPPDQSTVTPEVPTPTPTLAGTLDVVKDFTSFNTVDGVTYATYTIMVANPAPVGTELTDIVVDDTVSIGTMIESVIHTPGVVIEGTSSGTSSIRLRISTLTGGTSQGIVIAVRIPASGASCPGSNTVEVRQYALGDPVPSPLVTQTVAPTGTTPCAGASITPTSGPTATITTTPTLTPTATSIPPILPTATFTPTPTATVTGTPTVTPTGTLTPAPTSTLTLTPTPTSTLSEIGNYVWEDANDNGLQDTGESPISAAYVQLLNCTENTVALRTTTTNNQGNYLFSSLPTGCYRVKFYPVSGYSMCVKQHIDPNKTDLDSDPDSGWITQQINLGTNSSDLTIDACMRKIPIVTDLSLTVTASSLEPAVSSTVTLTLTVKNDGNQDASNVKVKGYVPSGLRFVSATPGDTSSGSYDPVEHLWDIGTIGKGTSRQLSLIFTVVGSSNLTYIAEIYSAYEKDSDSTPNNLSTAEDDYSVTTFLAKLVGGDGGRLADTGVASVLAFGVGSSLLIAAIAIEEMRSRVGYVDEDDD